MTPLRTIAGRVECETEVRKSRFVAVVDRAATEAEARAVIAAARKVDPAAGHHCSAFIVDSSPSDPHIDSAGEGQRIERSNDDGEPSGTAGTPMLDVLRGHHLTNVVAVVSRYFGGTKLGTGGLARAYGGAVAEALFEATFLTRERREILTLELDHAEVGRVESELRGHGVVVVGTSYGASAVLTVAVPDADSTAALVASLTAGRVIPVLDGHMYAEIPE
ncbi:IMPACT family protein [Rhodococcus sp. IEGM 1330]|uniref:IMPACT family protein n=1 Tax=Rhodococcus sp. IEGM 1330 TaxID=3082225 RepID=UPI0029544445|nr:YigZ family protein [Rhodococcus sp. IEGM 1330]MDV8022489.1 YigZ family protein [Rhodococcus sp. IEGM 1330]